jgi:phosphinothricin acetyltransferase
MSPILIRPAEQRDLPALLAIYNQYIETTAITFDVEPKTLAERQVWFDTFKPDGRYRCFVADDDGAAIGWACSGKFREKAAYQTSIETSIYVKPGAQGQGLGRKLYGALFAALAGEDVHRAYAGITIPNDASVGIHRAMGFALIGTYEEVGRKFGRYWNVAWYAKAL